jgi:hypothetical protein
MNEATGKIEIGRTRIEILGGRVWVYVVGDEGVLFTPAEFEARLAKLVEGEVCDE